MPMPRYHDVTYVVWFHKPCMLNMRLAAPHAAYRHLFCGSPSFLQFCIYISVVTRVVEFTPTHLDLATKCSNLSLINPKRNIDANLSDRQLPTFV
ncbi:hypothetical protein CEXT_396881 [Caerostris extrusa]|uniref:Uncharacterized protein n=1 Tax=Caerostris extrusa TaxID=172846 RepID=A0AAV4QAW6_CAEEX|nr:hypothetical protein CEXT_396881 [Caerostris extrusa]